MLKNEAIRPKARGIPIIMDNILIKNSRRNGRIPCIYPKIKIIRKYIIVIPTHLSHLPFKSFLASFYNLKISYKSPFLLYKIMIY